MSYDPRNLMDRFLNIKRLNSSINYMPSLIDPFDKFYPLNSFGKDRNRLTSDSKINKIPDFPYTSDMATELMNDLRMRQEELLKRVRKYPSKLDNT
jgi:hypothetical protein